MYQQLQTINQRPAPFSIYTAEELWTDPHTAGQMLNYHLDAQLPLASRTHDFIARSSAWIGEHFALARGKRVADFGCGPGLYTTHLARLGASVTGIDFSASSLHHARTVAMQAGLNIDYRQLNYLEFTSTERFDLIVMIMCDFCALSPIQRRQVLEMFRNHLSDHGQVLLDVYTLAGYAERKESSSYERRQLEGFWSPNDYFGFVNTFKYDREKVVLDKYTIVEEYRTRTVYNWLQYFDLETLKKECSAAGLAIEETFADVAGAAYDKGYSEMAVVLK